MDKKVYNSGPKSLARYPLNPEMLDLVELCSALELFYIFNFNFKLRELSKLSRLHEMTKSLSYPPF
jgi:hypothetical protein